MRWYILRTLLLKECLRHLADRGGIFFALLLVGAALLLSLAGKGADADAPLVGGVRRCFVDSWETQSPWVGYLRQHPPARRLNVFFRVGRLPLNPQGDIDYQESEAGIQIRPKGDDAQGRPRFEIRIHHPGKDPQVLAPYTEWFWRETLRYFHSRGLSVALNTRMEQLVYPGGAAVVEVQPGAGSPDFHGPRDRVLYRLAGASAQAAPVEMDVWHAELEGRADERSMVATGLVVFALCFFSVYLLPALTCEEHEQGVLLAQALSPASPQEILAAKFLFYPTLGMALGAVLAGIYSPAVLARPFFWAALVGSALGYLGVGMTIASLARTQRAASMGALCYLLSVTLLLFITQRFGLPSVQYLALEYYSPRVVHAALEGNTYPYGLDLVAVYVLAVAWVIVATRLFRKRGWQ